MTQVAEKLHPWVAARRPESGPRWLQDLRERAAVRFSALGFPTVREEDWRFTNVAPIAASTWTPPDGSTTVAPEQLDSFLYSEAPYRLVVVDGRYVPELSRVIGLPAPVRAGSLAAVST